MAGSEQAVIVRYRLTGSDYGSAAEREAIRELQQRLVAVIEERGVGEFDGNEFGGGEVVLYAYGPDADALFAVMESEVRRFPARPASALLRFGKASDPFVVERRIDL